MGRQRRIVFVTLQHDVDINVVGLVQGVELVARLVGMHLGLQRLHGRLEIGVAAGLDPKLGDDTDHVFSPYFFF